MSMDTQSTITTAARRIARDHNKCGGQLAGGILAYNAQGNGGEWYSATSRPNAAILFPVSHRRVSARQVQEFLDAADDYR
jgi:hypothetical protein